MFLFEKEIQKAIQWCDEEDKILLKMKKRGQTWKEIVKELPGRSGPACKSRYQVLQVTVYFEFFFCFGSKSEKAIYDCVGNYFLRKFVREMLRINIIHFAGSKFFGGRYFLKKEDVSFKLILFWIL